MAQCLILNAAQRAALISWAAQRFGLPLPNGTTQLVAMRKHPTLQQWLVIVSRRAALIPWPQAFVDAMQPLTLPTLDVFGFVAPTVAPLASQGTPPPPPPPPTDGAPRAWVPPPPPPPPPYTRADGAPW